MYSSKFSLGLSTPRLRYQWALFGGTSPVSINVARFGARVPWLTGSIASRYVSSLCRHLYVSQENFRPPLDFQKYVNGSMRNTLIRSKCRGRKERAMGRTVGEDGAKRYTCRSNILKSLGKVVGMRGTKLFWHNATWNE